jgi:hypothetical protein
MLETRGMEPVDFDDIDVAALAFRLAWPGEEGARPVPGAVKGLGRPERPRHPFMALLLPKKLLPKKWRRRLAARRQVLRGWPVALSVPSSDEDSFRMPSVKLTGRPLD